MRRRTRNSANGVEARLAALRTDLDALQKNLRGLVSDAKGLASDGMSEAGAFAGDAAERAQELAYDSVDSLRTSVRKQPLVACAISMSAGALIGAWLLRR